MFTHRTLKHFVLATIAIVLQVSTSTELQAGQQTTYDFVNTSSLQNGDTLSGTITLDSIGSISASNITSWSVTVTGPSNPFSMKSTDAGAGVAVDGFDTIADPTHLYILAPGASNSSQIRFSVGDKNLVYQRNSQQTFYDPDFGSFTVPANDFYGAAAANGVGAWENGIDAYLSNVWVVATAETNPTPPASVTPEPSTFLLCRLGGLFALVVSRKRKKNRRVEASGAGPDRSKDCE